MNDVEKYTPTLLKTIVFKTEPGWSIRSGTGHPLDPVPIKDPITLSRRSTRLNRSILGPTSEPN